MLRSRSRRGAAVTRGLAVLGEIAYRHRGRVVLAWIGAAILIIGVGSAVKGAYHADYNTPGSDSEAASEITKQRFAGYSGQEIYVVWREHGGDEASQRLLRPGGERRARLGAHFDSRVARRDDRRDHPSAHRSRLGGQNEPGRAADRGRERKQLRRGRDKARRRPNSRGRG